MMHRIFFAFIWIIGRVLLWIYRVDAVHFDTSKLSFEESEQALLSLIQEKLK